MVRRKGREPCRPLFSACGDAEQGSQIPKSAEKFRPNFLGKSSGRVKNTRPTAAVYGKNSSAPSARFRPSIFRRLPLSKVWKPTHRKRVSSAHQRVPRTKGYAGTLAETVLVASTRMSQYSELDPSTRSVGPASESPLPLKRFLLPWQLFGGNLADRFNLKTQTHSFFALCRQGNFLRGASAEEDGETISLRIGSAHFPLRWLTRGWEVNLMRALSGYPHRGVAWPSGPGGRAQQGEFCGRNNLGP